MTTGAGCDQTGGITLAHQHRGGKVGGGRLENGSGRRRLPGCRQAGVVGRQVGDLLGGEHDAHIVHQATPLAFLAQATLIVEHHLGGVGHLLTRQVRPVEGRRHPLVAVAGGTEEVAVQRLATPGIAGGQRGQGLAQAGRGPVPHRGGGRVMTAGLGRIQDQGQRQRQGQQAGKAAGAAAPTPEDLRVPAMGGVCEQGHLSVFPQAKQSAVKVRSQVC